MRGLLRGNLHRGSFRRLTLTLLAFLIKYVEGNEGDRRAAIPKDESIVVISVL